MKYTGGLRLHTQFAISPSLSFCFFFPSLEIILVNRTIIICPDHHTHNTRVLQLVSLFFSLNDVFTSL